MTALWPWELISEFVRHDPQPTALDRSNEVNGNNDPGRNTYNTQVSSTGSDS